MANGPLDRLLAGTAPRNLKLAIADGLVPLDETELIQAFSILCIDPDEEIRDTLGENIRNMPRNFIEQSSRSPKTPGDFLDFIAVNFDKDNEILAKIILNRNVKDQTLVSLAKTAPVEILDMLAGNRNRMLSCPEILDSLVENTRLPKITFYSLQEFKERFKDSFSTPDTEESTEQLSPASADISDESQDSDPAGKSVMADTADLDLSDELDELLGSHDDAVLDGETDFAGDEDEEEEDGIEFTDEDDEPADEWDIDYLTRGQGVEQEKAVQSDNDDDMDFERILNLTEQEEKTAAENDGDDDGNYSDWDELLSDDEFGSDTADDDDDDAETSEEEKIVDTRMRLLKMRAADKMVLAKMGTKQERAILVRDSNKKVAVAVVDGPKMSEFEIKLIAGNRSVSEDVLRAIYNNRVWGKTPSIRKELVMNPKTPMAISLRLLNNLNDFDLKDVIKSKEIPYGVSANAKRLWTQREQRRQGRKKSSH